MYSIECLVDTSETLPLDDGMMTNYSVVWIFCLTTQTSENETKPIVELELVYCYSL